MLLHYRVKVEHKKMVTNILKFVGLRLESTVEHCSVEQLNTSHYNSCTIGISQVNYTYFIQNT